MASSPNLSTAELLDAEITSLRNQLSSLKHTLALQTSTLLSSPIVSTILSSSSAPPEPNKHHAGVLSSSLPQKFSRHLQSRIADQVTHNTQSLYRYCVGITTFKVSDPDPCAVDDGRILGLCIEAPSTSRPGKFVRPYYVLLNRPWGGESDRIDLRTQDHTEEAITASLESRREYLKVHKHTVPECIPLAALAARWLPPPPSPSLFDSTAIEYDDNETYEDEGRSSRKSPKLKERRRQQNLPQFCRALRREILRYHNRTSIIIDLKRFCGLAPSYPGGPKPSNPVITSTRDEDNESSTTFFNNTVMDADPLNRSATSVFQEGESDRRKPDKNSRIIDVAPVDAEAKQIQIEWEDGRTGRLVLDDDGYVVKMAVFFEGERDRITVRQLLAGIEKPRVEDVIWKLRNL